MSLHKVFDAATPPASIPPGCEGVLGYVGGARATRIWTGGDWAPFADLGQFPCWVPPVDSDPVTEAAGAVAAVKELGWAAFVPEPNTRVIVADLEVTDNPAWWERFANAVELAGFIAVAYLSFSAAAAEFATDLWEAHWDVVPRLDSGQTIHAKQFQAGVPYGNGFVDLSVADEWMMARAGRGPRH